MTQDELLARFEEHLVGQGMAPATIANYVSDLQNLAGWFDEVAGGRSSLLSLDADHIRRHCHVLRKQGRSTSTVNRRLQAVRKFFDYAVQTGLSPHNPARDVDRLRERATVSPHALTTDQVRRLLRSVNAGTDSLARRDRAVLHLLLDTGIKVRELVELTREDLDLDVGSGYVWVGQDLESGGRCLALGPEACAALRDYLRVRAPAPGTSWLFVSRQGQALSVRTVQRLVSSRAGAVGLEGVSAQTLRYTFAHDALEERDLAQVARLLGLANVDDVRRYLG